MEEGNSIFGRLISLSRPWWARLLFVAVLFGTPLMAVAVDGVFDDFWNEGQWRGVMMPPSIILYVLLVAPWLSRMEEQVITSFRSISLIEKERFDQIVHETNVIDPKKESIAIILGGLLGIWVVIGSYDPPFSYLSAVWTVSTVLLYALLGLTVYVSLISPRFPVTVLRLPVRINPLDITPFQSIGRQSLAIALVFIGGVTISFALIAFDLESILRVEFWVLHIFLVFVSVLIFFLNMVPTHRAIVKARQSELDRLRRHVHRISGELLQRMDQQKDCGELAQEINALLGYEDRLRMAKTWPYNTETLRFLFFSVLLPAGAVLAQIILERFIG